MNNTIILKHCEARLTRDFEDYRKKAYNYNWQPKKAQGGKKHEDSKDL